jgi:hypothetical protein
VFIQSVQLLPEGQRQKLGMVYFRGSKLETLLPKYKAVSENMGITLVVKDFDGKKDIERQMRGFKVEGVNGIVLFPPSITPDDLAEIVRWQNRLRFPVNNFVEKYAINLRATNILQQEIPDNITLQAEIIR